MNAFANCTSLKSVELPINLENFVGTAFSGCSNLASISISDENPNFAVMNNVLYNKAFTTLFYCTPATEIVTIEPTVETIGASAFQDCKLIKSIKLPNSVKHIASMAFTNCESLEELVLGESLQSIEAWSNAFGGCKSLKSITCLMQTPIATSYEGFTSINFAEATLYVPKGTSAVYSVVAPWMNFENIVELDDSAVDAINAENISIVVSDNRVIINGVPAATEVSLYDINGRCVYNGFDAEINVAVCGIYILKVLNNTFKVII